MNYDKHIEDEMAKIRHLREMKKLNWVDIYQPGADKNQDDFALHLNVDDSAKNNTRLPGELQKILNVNVPELQQMAHPV